LKACILPWRARLRPRHLTAAGCRAAQPPAWPAHQLRRHRRQLRLQRLHLPPVLLLALLRRRLLLLLLLRLAPGLLLRLRQQRLFLPAQQWRAKP
jgi:hypothetical protein